jgi:hypothetical protein
MPAPLTVRIGARLPLTAGHMERDLLQGKRDLRQEERDLLQGLSNRASVHPAGVHACICVCKHANEQGGR